jgi:uncharacterized membrane protein
MNTVFVHQRSTAADAVYGLLNPIPFGCFVGGLIFDIVYARTGELLWDKSASWLIAIGLVFAVLPRLINLFRVWGPSRHTLLRAERFDFWFNLLAIVVAIFNSFVHSRDAYGVVPTGMLLSACTVILLAIGNIMISVLPAAIGSPAHE